MSVSSELNRVTYTGNGATTAFAVSFPFQETTDLVVVETIIATGVQTTKTITTHYTVSGTVDTIGHYSSGGTVTAVTAPASTVRWTIYRDPPATQTLNLSENNAIPAESLEAALDYTAMLAQRQAELTSRSLRQPDGDSADISTIPSKVDRASKYLAFDANGDPLATSGTSETPNALLKSGGTMTGALVQAVGANVASASTLNLTAVAGNACHVTGTTTITAVTLATGKFCEVIFDGILTLTHHATNNNLPSAANITTAAGDRASYWSDGTTVYCVRYQRADGTAVVATTPAGIPTAAQFGKLIYGLTYDNGTDATNDLNINVGGAMDATSAYWMTLATALGKQSDVAWAVGGTTAAPAGGLDTGAVGNNEYYIWLIARSDTGVVDALFSLSATAPTMPANYNYKRLIGWFKRVGGTIVGCKTYETEGGGLELLWASPRLDVNLANTLTTSRRTDVVKVPTSFSVTANLNIQISDGGAEAYVYVYCPDLTDVAASATAAPLFTLGRAAALGYWGGQRNIRTSATGTIAAIASIATVDTYAVSTLGFTWSRRN